jgi:RNA polymerase primary sigma factor
VSRRLKQTFRCGPLDGLTRQLLFSPPDKRVLQVQRIERLHDQLDPGKNYPLDFLFYRITGYRREGKDAVLLTGEAVLPDLRLMIDTLSRSVRMPMDGADPVETVRQLADRLHVSTKTIGRWRRAGMRWRWVAPAGGGRKVVVVPRVASDRFIEDHPQQVRRASSFTQIDPVARRRLVERARKIARRRDVSLNQVAAHLSEKTGRALETIRKVLENHDRDHRGRAIFTGRTGPLTGRQKRVIARAYRVGVPVERIASRFKRTRSTIYRAVHQHRAGKAGRVSLNYFASPTFNRDDADEVILGRPLDELTRSAPAADAPLDDLPEPVRPLFRQPAIAPDRVRALFVRYNYLKHRAAQTREGFDRYSPGAKQVRRFDELASEAQSLRDLLVRVHLPVVLSVSRRHLIGDHPAGGMRLVDLLERGLEVLIQAVESFNPSRQRRFDSFLTNRLMARFASEAGGSGAAGSAQAQRRVNRGDVLRRLTELADEAGVRIYDL